MRRRINLYWSEFKPQFRWLNAGTIAGVWLIALIVVTSISVWLNLVTAEQNASFSQAQQRTMALDEELALAKSKLAERKPSEALSDELENLTLSLSQKEMLIEELGGEESRVHAPFFQAMNGFAEVADGSIWLTRFVVQGERLSLYGEINNPNAFPAWLQRLGDKRYFSQKEFEVIKLSRDVDEEGSSSSVLSFELLSEPVLDSDEAAENE